MLVFEPPTFFCSKSFHVTVALRYELLRAGRALFAVENAEEEMKKFLLAGTLFGLSGCVATEPVQHFASPNGIALRYKAYDTVLTLTAQARDLAVQHCAKYRKHANYKGGNAVSPLSAEEIHNFACEAVKTDDSAIISAQSERPEIVPVFVPYAVKQQPGW